MRGLKGYIDLGISDSIKSLARNYAYMRHFIRKIDALKQNAETNRLDPSMTGEDFLEIVRMDIDSLHDKLAKSVAIIKRMKKKLRNF